MFSEVLKKIMNIHKINQIQIWNTHGGQKGQLQMRIVPFLLVFLWDFYDGFVQIQVWNSRNMVIGVRIPALSVRC